jgi:uncharacterized protein (DUF58 family)
MVYGAISFYVLRHLKIGREIPSDIFAGDDVAIKLTITNDKNTIPIAGLVGREIIPMDLKNHVGGLTDAPILPSLPGNSSNGVYWGRFTQRGNFTLKGISLRSNFPAGLFITKKAFSCTDSFVVFPRLLRVKPKFQEYITNLSAYAGLKTQPGQGEEEFKALREYQTGHSLKHIHWRSSAKWNKLMVREYEPPQIEFVYIFLDAGVPANDRRKQIRFETALSITASLIYHLALMEKKIWFCAVKKELEWVGPFTLGPSMYNLLNHLALLTPLTDSTNVKQFKPLYTEFTSAGLVILISLDDIQKPLTHSPNFLHITPERYNEFVELIQSQQIKEPETTGYAKPDIAEVNA